MMANLFSIFDPSTQIFNLSLNWASSLLFLFLLPTPYWLLNSRNNQTKQALLSMMHKEIIPLLTSNYPSALMLPVTLIIFIMTNNFLGLFPYIFTSTSHIMAALSLALPLWLSTMLFGWLNNTISMLAHLVPSGTPLFLTVFMVCVETISSLIRPITLSVRLTANMIAGHLLMTLLGSLASVHCPLLLIVFPVQIMLIMLESAVALIQAYVFTILIALYMIEVN